MNGPETPVLQDRVNKLQNQVNEYRLSGTGKTSGISLQNILASKKLYYIVPILILVFLLWLRPSFITDEVGDEFGNVSYKISFKKLLLSWVVITIALFLGLFGYNFKRKNESM